MEYMSLQLRYFIKLVIIALMDRRESKPIVNNRVRLSFDLLYLEKRLTDWNTKIGNFGPKCGENDENQHLGTDSKTMYVFLRSFCNFM